MKNFEWVSAFLFPLLALLVGSYLTYYFTDRAKRVELVREYKVEKYSKLLVCIHGFLENAESKEQKQEFLNERSSAWLYSSDEVILTVNKFLEIAEGKSAKEEGTKAIGDIVIAMRRDLGIKTSLLPSQFKYYFPTR